jgi:hypothetical protein
MCSAERDVARFRGYEQLQAAVDGEGVWYQHDKFQPRGRPLLVHCELSP